jgi:hypothetical protein
MLRGCDEVVKRWDKCINIGEGYVEKQMLLSRFEYHMLYVLQSFLVYLLTLPRIYISGNTETSQNTVTFSHSVRTSHLLSLH